MNVAVVAAFKANRVADIANAVGEGKRCIDVRRGVVNVSKFGVAGNLNVLAAAEVAEFSVVVGCAGLRLRLRCRC